MTSSSSVGVAPLPPQCLILPRAAALVVLLAWLFLRGGKGTAGEAACATATGTASAPDTAGSSRSDGSNSFAMGSMELPPTWLRLQKLCQNGSRSPSAWASQEPPIAQVAKDGQRPRPNIHQGEFWTPASTNFLRLWKTWRCCLRWLWCLWLLGAVVSNWCTVESMFNISQWLTIAQIVVPTPTTSTQKCTAGMMVCLLSFKAFRPVEQTIWEPFPLTAFSILYTINGEGSQSSAPLVML